MPVFGENRRMKAIKVWDKGVWLVALAVVGAFFLPWVGVTADAFRAFEVARQKGFGDMLGGFEQQLRTQTQGLQTAASIRASGFDIPRLVNTQDSRMALAWVGMFTSKTEGLEWKSYAVYVFPVLALLLALLHQLIPRPLARIVIAAVAAAVAAGTFYKLTHLPLESWVTQTKIGWGMWITISAYAVLALCALSGGLAALSGKK